MKCTRWRTSDWRSCTIKCLSGEALEQESHFCGSTWRPYTLVMIHAAIIMEQQFYHVEVNPFHFRHSYTNYVTMLILKSML